jgi:uncharacterized protein
MKKLPCLAAALAAIAFSVSTAQAASFNCRYAKLPAEVAICDDAELEQLDEDMSRIYFRILEVAEGADRAELKRTQRRFIAKRNACGYNDGCIARAYERRIEFLENNYGD